MRYLGVKVVGVAVLVCVGSMIAKASLFEDHFDNNTPQPGWTNYDQQNGPFYCWENHYRVDDDRARWSVQDNFVAPSEGTVTWSVRFLIHPDGAEGHPGWTDHGMQINYDPNVGWYWFRVMKQNGKVYWRKYDKYFNIPAGGEFLINGDWSDGLVLTIEETSTELKVYTDGNLVGTISQTVNSTQPYMGGKIVLFTDCAPTGLWDDVVITPEPATIGLFCLGILGFIKKRR